MIKYFSKLLFGFFFTFLTNELIAQVYPVQGTTTLIPPYALRLSDYQTSINERVVLNAFLADVTKPELHVRFRIRIEGQNVKLETKPEYIGSMVTMSGGVPLRLSNIELAEYFDPNHLNFSGISKNDFLKTGFLPEGFYQFCFEVLEYNRGVKISNSICAPAWLIMNDPPIINLPLTGSKLKPLSPQNVIFQWTPRHTGSPNAAFSTEYDVKVVEVWPANRNPNDAILTQPPIYEITTNSTTLIYGPDATQLEPGRVYAFRVQARAMAGADHFDLFKNNGYSETVSFIYGDACDAPINIIAEASTPTRISLQWDASPSQTSYTVQYRVKGQADGHWYFNTSLLTSAEISGLQPNTSYEYQVMSTCGSFESQYGNIATITTPDLSQSGYTCGVPPENFNLDPSQLIPVLKVGEVIKTGDFDVTVTKITGANGLFSGEGVVVVPFLNQVKARVKFSDITVNNYKRLVNGYMNVTGGGVEVVPAGAMDQLSQSLSVADSILSLTRQYFAPPPDPSSFVPDQVINVPAGIQSVIKDPISGNIIVIDNKGQTQTIPSGKNIAITDGAGNGVIVNQNGGKANVSDPQLAAILKREYNLSLTFAKTLNTSYGLDQQKLDQLKSNYEKLGDNYYVSWKAVSSQADPVVATYNGKDNIADKIKFELDGTPATATANGNSFTINIAEAASQMPSSIVAKVANGDKEQILGKLNIVGYDAKPMNLKIVRVNNVKLDVDASTVKKQLDSIYSQAVVSWNVEVVEQTLQVTNVSDPFDDGSSGLLSNYTKDMKEVINAYGTLAPDTYYLFLIDKPASGNKLGYMPRGKKVGFIFTETNTQSLSPNTLITTVAHELGHGAFTLKHTFFEYTSLAQGTTDNLMDYNNGTNLWKYQWDRIHDPAVVLGLFEGDDAGASFKHDEGVVGYVISDPQSYKRSNVPPYNIIEPREVLTKGEEIAVITTEAEGKMSIIRLLDKDPFYITSSANISKITKISKPEKYVVVRVKECTVLPYSSDNTGHIPEKGSYVTPNKACRNFLQIKEDAITNRGWWIERSSVMKLSSDLIEGIQWVSQYDESIFGKETCFCAEWNKSCNNICCARAVKYMMKQFDVTPNTGSKICVAELSKVGDYSNVTGTQDFEKGLQYLEATVKSKKDGGKPVMIGVHYPKDKAPSNLNPCPASFHYLLIVGKGYDEELKQDYFRFFDVGAYTDRVDAGASEGNKLYVDKSGKKISGTYRDKIYTITEVIPNN